MAQAEYTTAVLADTPVAFYKMDEASGLPQDSSGNSRHITGSAGTPAYRNSSPFPNAYGIQGSSINFTIPYFSSVADNTTIELWVKLTSAAASLSQVLANGTGGFGWQLYQLANSTLGNLRLYSDSNALEIHPHNVDDQWAHCAFVLRSGTWEYYYQGDLWLANAGAEAGLGTPTGNFSIFGASAGNREISNVAVYETALSAARIRAHYEAAIGWTAKPLNATTRSALAFA